jgi:hypothetical protein
MNFIQDSATFEKSLGMLARADFERAMRLALAITPSDVSALAPLSVCRGALVGPGKQREENGVREKNPGRNHRDRKSERQVDILQTGQYDTPSFLAR